MKSKLLLVMLTVMTCMFAQRSNAQTRYLDSVFAAYTMSTVTYSTVYNLQMDIYQPTGDAVTKRPVVVLAHEGTFYTGTRANDPSVVPLCQDLAHKGYVTVSIDYRLTSAGNLINADSAATEVFRAVGDAKAAIRYLHEYADSFKLDTNYIFIGGNSAGAVLAMHYAYIDSMSQLNVNAIFPPIVNAMGGLEGNSGNPGYSSKVTGVISLAGGLNQSAWLGRCSLPIAMAQGDQDAVVPYTCANAENGVVPLQLCGLGSLQANITANTPYSSTLVFPGQGHVPWDGNAAMFTQIDTLVTGFLYKEVTNAVPATCISLGIQNVANTANISLYPNPATDLVNFRSTKYISAITVADEMGRTIVQTNDIHSLDYHMNTSGLSTGVYIVRIYNEQEQMPVIRKVTIE